MPQNNVNPAQNPSPRRRASISGKKRRLGKTAYSETPFLSARPPMINPFSLPWPSQSLFARDEKKAGKPRLKLVTLIKLCVCHGFYDD
jgi:hypothetical protein